MARMTAEETRAVLERFYGALARRDGETMAALYADDATFEDEVFRLRGADIGKMWIGLLRRARNFSVAYTIAQAGNGHGTVEWTASTSRGAQARRWAPGLDRWRAWPGPGAPSRSRPPGGWASRRADDGRGAYGARRETNSPPGGRHRSGPDTAGRRDRRGSRHAPARPDRR